MKPEKKEILYSLYIELVKLQKEIINSKLKVLVILEGRDAAGKDGTIKALTLHGSPRETRTVALGKPSDRQEHEWYFQRFVRHLPAAGEWVIFNRSWYNRAGVEKVMGFCTEKEYNSFFRDVALFEEMLTNAGIVVLKYYLDISKEEQAQRLKDRETDPLKQWKISPVDMVAQKLWKEYSKARDHMLLHTCFVNAPWHIVDAEKKSDAHVAVMTHILNHIDYKDKDKHLLQQENKIVYTATEETVSGRAYK